MSIFDRIIGQKTELSINDDKDGWHIPIDLLELKNSDRNVSLRDALESQEMQAAKSPLSFPLGLDENGKFYIADLHRLSHIMSGGMTASGKSSFTEGTLILSLIYRNSPDDLKLILIDPKYVQFVQYGGIPHLLRPVINSIDDAKNSVEWLLSEMENRFDILSKSDERNIVDYNNSDKGHMPYIVMIIDEVSDLMATDRKFFQESFISILQKSRNVGIHLYIGTSSPRPDVLPGILKANFPTTIAFTTSTLLDSRRLIDSNAAAELTCKGDLLFNTFFEHSLIRLQAPYASETEQSRVVNYLLKNYKFQGGNMTNNDLRYCPSCGHILTSNIDDDELYKEVVELVRAEGKASPALVQRKIKVGYARAARIMDKLEDNGVIGSADGAKPRKVIY